MKKRKMYSWRVWTAAAMLLLMLLCTLPAQQAFGAQYLDSISVEISGEPGPEEAPGEMEEPGITEEYEISGSFKEQETGSRNPENAPEQAEGVYQIGTARELQWFADLVNGTLEGVEKNPQASAVLTADIDLNPGYTVTAESEKSQLSPWTPIQNFQGTFDGNGKTITGVYIESDNSFVGFFGRIASYGEWAVRDLTISGSYIRGRSWTGALAGELEGSASGCTITDTVTVSGDGWNYIGGLFGAKSAGAVTGCINQGTVSGAGYVGGIIGHNENGAVTDCENAGEISAASNRAGGICGSSDSQDGSITGCGNTGKISGRREIGGIAGYSSGDIEDCRNAGPVSGTGEDVGGIVGEKGGNTQIAGCTNEGAVTGGTSHIGGIAGYGENTELKILQCGNSGAVSGQTEAGGVAGRLRGYMEYCFNTGDVSGTGTLGGLTGVNEKSIRSCYNTGRLTYAEEEKTGGITGERTSGGSVENCYYLDTIDRGIGQGYENQETVRKTVEQFASGNVTWEMNQGVTDGSQIWYQTAGVGLPGFAGETIYRSWDCGVYNNTENSENLRHSFDTRGFCTGCGWYQPAEKNTEGAYEITNPGKLYWFAALVNNDPSRADFFQGDPQASAVLTGDIRINEGEFSQPVNSAAVRDWTPIGASGNPYRGTFDGDGHTIYGLYCCRPGNSDNGLIGAAEGVLIRNLTLADSYVAGERNTGGICGSLTGTVENCVNQAVIAGNNDYTGGIAGYLKGSGINCKNQGTVSGKNNTGGIVGRGEKNGDQGRLENCENTGSIYGETTTGGIVGGLTDMPVTGCTNAAPITGAGNYAGGIAGQADRNQDAPVLQCLNTGEIRGGSYTGGIIGRGSARQCGNQGKVSGSYRIGGISGENSRGHVRESYNWGSVSGEQYVGGVVGDINGYGGNVENCYSTGEVTGNSSVGGVIGRYVNSGPLGTNYYLDTSAAAGVGEGTPGSVQSRTGEQFASGEVAWKLNQGITEGTQVWYQDLGADAGEEADPAPVFSGGVVYPGETCISYTNRKPEGESLQNHRFGEESNGFCQDCGQYEEPEKNPEGIYEIKNGGQLYWFAALVNGDSSSAQIGEKDSHANAILEEDITINPGPVTGDGSGENLRSWEPIGTEGASYYGAFEGNNKTISGLYCSQPSRDNIGLFGHIHNEGLVGNLTVKDSYFEGANYVGAIAGRGWQLQENIINCHNENTLVSGSGQNVGGVIGICHSSVDGCTNSGAVTGGSYTGGIAGNCRDVFNSENRGTVTGGDYTGGIGGIIEYAAYNCSNSGAVTGADRTGGLCGSQSRNMGFLNSFNTGQVTGRSYVGGITGAASGYLEGCYNAGAVAGTENYIGSICGRKSSSGAVFKNCYYQEGTASLGIGSGGTEGTDAQVYSQTAFRDGTVRSLLQGYVFQYEGDYELNHWRQAEMWPVFVEGEPVIQVSLSWDSMEFVYTEEGRGVWNPKDHCYEGATEEGWSSQSGEIRIANHGNTDIRADFSYEPEPDMKDVTGTFLDQGGAKASAVEIPAGTGEQEEEMRAELKLSGSPAAFEGSKKLGSVTVQIQESGMPLIEE